MVHLCDVIQGPYDPAWAGPAPNRPDALLRANYTRVTAAGHRCGSGSAVLDDAVISAKVPVPVRQLAAAGPGPGAAVWCYMSVPSRQRRGVRQEAATPERGTDGRVGQSREVVCLCADGDDEWAHLGHQMLL